MLDIIFEKLNKNSLLTKEEIIYLLNLDINSFEMSKIFNYSNSLSRKNFNNKGIIFAQIGLDNSPCSKNCNFCFFGAKHGLISETKELSLEEIKDKVQEFLINGVDEIFLMSTADYSFDKFLNIAREVRKIIPQNIKFVANTGDLKPQQISMLEEVGFTGAYHICRLGEEKDTDISIEERCQTLENIKNSSLELYYCIEPIGPEHTSEEIAEEILRGIKYETAVMAVMRRVPVPGTPFENYEKISEYELAKICAIVRSVFGNSIRAMGVHEPSLLSLIVGANQIYAEKGCNPRDIKKDTENSRGFSVEKTREFLKEANWNC